MKIKVKRMHQNARMPFYATGGREVNDLIERLRAVKWEEVYDDDRMPDDPTHKCVLVDMRPDDFRALLREAADALEAARAEMDALRKAIDRAWNEGFDFAMKARGWQEGDPTTEGLYVVRDSKGNVEVGMWYARTLTQPAEWTQEFRDVDRDDIVAWMAIPDWRTARNAYKLADAMLRAREASND